MFEKLFKFLFDRTRYYRVFYRMKGGSFVMEVVIGADSAYKANRKFDQEYGSEVERLPNSTEDVTAIYKEIAGAIRRIR